MSTVFVAAILIGFVVFFVALVTANERRKKQNHIKQFLIRFSKLGLRHNLSFSSQEILPDAAIGLDGVHRKLLILNGTDETIQTNQLLDLNEVKMCMVKKEYGIIAAADVKGRDQYLEKIVLHFSFRNGQEPTAIKFYDHLFDDIHAIKEMSEKAKHWEVMLSKMLKAPVQGVA